MGRALQWFGVCADKCAGPGDPHLRPVLYFGSQVAARAYFALRGAGHEVSASQLDGWRFSAETLIRACWEVHPEDSVAAHNLGRFLHDCDEWAEAIRMYRTALHLKHTQVESWGNLGTAYANTGDREAAERCWRQCVAFEAENPSGALAQAYVYLRRGDYAPGWARWERRWDEAAFAQGYGRKELTGRRWDGAPLGEHDTLFVHGEQGLGDHVMFARYVPLLLARGLTIAAVETRLPLVRWMERALSGVRVVARAGDGTDVPHTHHVSTMSLPSICGTLVGTVPDPVTPVMWRPPQNARRRVALAWSGAAGNPTDAMRSLPASVLEGLRGLDVDWVSVQFTPHAGLIARSWLGVDVVDASDTCTDVLDTTHLLATCDLCVTVDTLTAHVAGAMGMPAIVLHRYDREWRWFEAQPERSIWYASHRSWTQAAPQDWAPLVERVRRELLG